MIELLKRISILEITNLVEVHWQRWPRKIKSKIPYRIFIFSEYEVYWNQSITLWIILKIDFYNFMKYRHCRFSGKKEKKKTGLLTPNLFVSNNFTKYSYKGEKLTDKEVRFFEN